MTGASAAKSPKTTTHPASARRAAASAWLPEFRRSGSGSAVLCFPPAGAGAGFYRDWPAQLPMVRLVPVQLPGREERFSEPALSDALELAAAIADAVEAEGWQSVVLLGYSFGCLLAFETARRLEAQGSCRVLGLLACARGAPQTVPIASVADKTDADVMAHVRALGGLPPEIDATPEFAELLIPALRADFRANDRYAAPADRRIAAPITVLAGQSDAATSDGRAAAWEKRTTGDFRLVEIPGGHFFVRETPTVCFETVARETEAFTAARPFAPLGELT